MIVKTNGVPINVLILVWSMLKETERDSLHRRRILSFDEDDGMIDTALLLLYARMKESKNKDDPFVYSRNRHLFYRHLSLAQCRYRSNKIPRCALQDPKFSSFQKLFESNNDQALIATTGFDHSSFKWMLERFAPLYDTLSPYAKHGYLVIKHKSNGGRPRSLDARGCLGLILMWTRTRGNQNVLCMIFGITHDVCSTMIRFGRRILCHVLSREDVSRVKMPDRIEEIESLQEMVRQRHPTLGEEGVCFACDGLKLYLEQSGNFMIQNMFYNGWTHDHYVTNIFVFAPNGTIIAMVINGPGALHDSTMATYGELYEKMQYIYQRFGAKSCVDSAFFAINTPYMVKSAQEVPVGAEQRIRNLHEEATSFRQASEWGMRGLQGSFPRIKDRFIYEERGERKIILKLIVLLYNLRANLVGINQIRNTYMRNLASDPRDYFNIDDDNN